MLRDSSPATVVATSPGAAEMRRRLGGLAGQASLETTTRATPLGEACTAPLRPGTSVYITWLPGDTLEARVAAARQLRRAGLNPVPHLAARYLASGIELRDIVRRLNGEAGVDEVLLIGGDTERVRGPFASSLAVLEDGSIAALGIRRVGLAAYPEGHPRIPAAILDAALDAKIERARALDLDPHVVTQFCFEAGPILDWLGRFRARRGDVPVHVGLAGPARLTTLLTYAATCGIGASLRALRRQVGLSRLLTEAGPEPILHELAAAEACAAIHIFTFGGVARTAAWLGSLARGGAAPPVIDAASSFPR